MLEHMGNAMEGFMMLLRWAVSIWFLVFTIIVVVKLNKIERLLEKK